MPGFGLFPVRVAGGPDRPQRRGRLAELAAIELRLVLGDAVLEVRRKYLLRLAPLAAFGDFGTAWDTSEEFSDHWIAGGGVGIRLIIPQMVMMRFDLAFGEPALGVSFHFGTDEKAAAQRFRIR